MEMIEATGEKFKIQEMMRIRELSKTAVKTIASRVRLGMNHSDGQHLIQQVLHEMGAVKQWHPAKFRIDQDSIKNFRETADESITIQEGSVFFIDIGPVWDDHEGDYGETYVFGQNTEKDKIAKAAEAVFKETEKIWKKEKLTGKELYQRASQYTQSLGYKLNMNMDGHRVGDFPHALFFKGELATVDICPKPYLWVLEIHVLSLDDKYGAFFEDILL